MPITYESYAYSQTPAKFTPAKFKDVERTITIALAAGRAVIADAHAFDQAGDVITKQSAGGPVGLYVSLGNTGDKDYIWCTIKDKDTGAIVVRKDGIKCETEQLIDKNKSFGWTAATPKVLDMPNKNWNLLVEAGHGR